MGCHQNARRLLKLSRIRGKGCQYRPDLSRMNAPHPGKSKCPAGLSRCSEQLGNISEFSHHAVGCYLAEGVAGCRNFKLGTQHQGVAELTQRSVAKPVIQAHGRGRYGAAMR